MAKLKSKNRVTGRLAKAMRAKDDPKASKFAPSVAYFQKWYAVINREVFNETLPVPTLEVRRRHGIWGEAAAHLEGDAEKVVTSISMNHRFHNRKHSLKILAHEMVHIAEWMEKKTMAHSDYFWSWKEPLAKHGLKLE